MEAKSKNEKFNCLIDSSALKDMFEGKKHCKANEMMIKMKDLSDAGKNMNIFTTSASLLNAIFLADPKTNINKIQKVLSFITVIPSSADHKIQRQCNEELFALAKKLSGRKDE